MADTSVSKTERPENILELRGNRSDEEIIALYFARNEEAIRETDAKYGRYLMKIAYNYLDDYEDAEECKNDTFLGAWNAIPPTRPKVLRAFLATLNTRIAINRYKEKTREKRVPSAVTVSIDELAEYVGAGDTVEDRVTANELSGILNRFVRGLSENDRFLFVNRYYLGESVADIATLVGKSESLVKKQLGKAKKQLKELLEREGYLG